MRPVGGPKQISEKDVAVMMALSLREKKLRRERLAETARLSLAAVGLTLLVWLAQLVDQFYSSAL